MQKYLWPSSLTVFSGLSRNALKCRHIGKSFNHVDKPFMSKPLDNGMLTVPINLLEDLTSNASRIWSSVPTVLSWIGGTCLCSAI